MSGTSLDFPNSGGLSAPVIFKGGNTSPADNYMRLVQQDMAARSRKREQPQPKEEDFRKGIPTPWYRDIPELLAEGEKLKEIGAIMNDPKQPKEVRAQAAVDFQYQKGVIWHKSSKSNNDGKVYTKLYGQVIKNPDGHEEGEVERGQMWADGKFGGTLERGEYQPKIANDKDAWDEFRKLPKDAISIPDQQEKLNPDGFSKTTTYTTKYNPEAAKQRLEIWKNGNSEKYRKARGVLAAHIKTSYPEIEENHPIEYNKLLDDKMAVLADIESKSQFKPIPSYTKTTGAPRAPKGTAAQKPLSEMMDYVHEKNIPTADGKFISSAGSMALPSGIKSRTTIAPNIENFNPLTNQFKKGDEGTVDFSGGEINVIRMKKTGEYVPYVFATSVTQEEGVPDSNGNPTYKKVETPIAVPLNDVKSVLQNEGINYKWADELASKKNSNLAQPKSGLGKYPPNVQNGIKAYMKAKNIDEATAIQKLTDAGKIK